VRAKKAGSVSLPAILMDWSSIEKQNGNLSLAHDLLEEAGKIAKTQDQWLYRKIFRRLTEV
jgi:hypothetical protein